MRSPNGDGVVKFGMGSVSAVAPAATSGRRLGPKIVRDPRNNGLAAARVAADRGDMAGVAAFIDRVHSVMSTEFAEWVTLEDLDAGRSAKHDPAAMATTGSVTSRSPEMRGSQ